MTSAPPPSSERWGRNDWLAWLATVVAVGLLLFFRYYLAELASATSVDFLRPFIREMTGALGGGLLFFPLRWIVRAWPLERPLRPARLVLYAAVLPVFSVLHTTMNWGFRTVFYELAGFGTYHYGTMPLRYLMELPGDLLVQTIMIAAIHGVDRLRAARERELRTAQLESSLARLEVRNLRLQLQPHFLFNALNTISATMYEQPAAADEMLDRLAELLRASLRTAQTDEVPLTTELETLECYLAIMRARFGERLTVEMEINPATRDALVPSMLLQPLVENAIRHGGVESTGRGRIELRIARRGGDLVVEIEDDGPGCAGDEELASGGIGLQATAERLRLLYDSAGHLEAGNVAGGFRVTAVMPYRSREERAS